MVAELTYSMKVGGGGGLSFILPISFFWMNSKRVTIIFQIFSHQHVTIVFFFSAIYTNTLCTCLNMNHNIR